MRNNMKIKDVTTDSKMKEKRKQEGRQADTKN